MNRHSFFQRGIKEIFSHLWESPAGQLVDRQLQALANILAPEGLDSYLEQETPPSCFPRPPGSLPLAEDFEEACTRCGDCHRACPYGAIEGDESTGPFLDPNHSPCHLCLDYPCINACKEGALLPLPEHSLPGLGKARLRPGLCLNHTEARSCELCQQSCPVPDALILSGDGVKGLPEFGDSCTGCGLCRLACPTIPVAIEIVYEEMLPSR